MSVSSATKKAKMPAKRAKPYRASAAHVRPKVHIYPGDCMVVEQAVHSGRASDGGYVEFHAEGDCTLRFLNTAVFGASHEYETFTAGTRRRLHVCIDGPASTEYEIVGCEERACAKSTLRVATMIFSGPKEIIVP